MTCTPKCDTPKGHNVASVTVLPNMNNPNLSLRKCHTIPNQGALYKAAGQESSEMQRIKDKERLRNCPRLEETEEPQLLQGGILEQKEVVDERAGGM